MEIAQSPLELNALQDKLPWLIAGNILWCIICTLMWILPRNLVHVLKDSKRGVLIQFHTNFFLEKFPCQPNKLFWISNFRWKEVVQWVKDKLSITYSLAFSYFDDEGDLIFVSVHVLHDDIWALYNLTSVSMFSILFPWHFLWYWQGEFV